MDLWTKKGKLKTNFITNASTFKTLTNISLYNIKNVQLWNLVG